MTTQVLKRRPYQPGHLNIQIVLLLCLLLVVMGFLATMHIDSYWQTLALFLFVAVVGLRMITGLTRQIHDPHVQKLGYVYLIKLLALLILLHVAWIPMLDPSSPNYGYDPQRYYYLARSLADTGFNISAIRSIENLNYIGIVYYYGVVFALLGQNPVLPALINAFVTLLATLLLVRVGYMIKRERNHHDWWLGLAMVLPEVIWFDVMTARETLTMALIAIITLSVAGYLIRRADDRFSLKNVLVAVPALLLLALVRSSFMLAPLAAIALLILTMRQTKRNRAVGLGALVIVVLVILLEPAVSLILGSSGVGYTWIFSVLTGLNQNATSQVLNLEGLGTFARLLIPTNPIQAALFVPARLLLYLIAPLGVASFQLDGLMQGNWISWQFLMMALSALLNLLLFPLAVASLLYSLQRKGRSLLAFNLPLWITLGMIAGGNLIVHDRYRVAATLLLWGGYWLGRACPKRLIYQVYAIWFGILLFGGMAYVFIKFIA